MERKKSSGRSSHGDEAAPAGEAKGLVVSPGSAIGEVQAEPKGQDRGRGEKGRSVAMHTPLAGSSVGCSQA